MVQGSTGLTLRHRALRHLQAHITIGICSGKRANAASLMGTGRVRLSTASLTFPGNTAANTPAAANAPARLVRRHSPEKQLDSLLVCDFAEWIGSGVRRFPERVSVG